MQFTARARGIVAALTTAAVAAVPLAAYGGTDPATALPPAPAEKALTTVPALADPDVGRQVVPEDEYAMALGCYELTNVAAGAGLERDGAGYVAGDAAAFHFEPTQLGQYLLLDPEGQVLAAAGGPVEQVDETLDHVEFHAPVGRDTDLPRSVDDDLPAPLEHDDVEGNLPAVDTHTGEIVAGEAGPAADWRARQNVDGTLTFTLPAAAGRALAVVDGVATLVDAGTAGDAENFTLRSVDEADCAEWPEIPVNVEGPVLAGATEWDETRGTIDAHLHLMTYEFLGGELRCGRPWHPYGVTEAMGDCSQNSLTGERLAEAAVGRGPGDGSDAMWPAFTVPTNRTLTYEQVYHRWLERAWRGGLRMMTVLLVDNNVLCEVYPYKRNSCNEMDAVRLQAQRLHEFVDYLDARAGGPGEGWAQIATDPFEARRIVNEGRLALVLGIEVSVLFDCGEYLGVSRCTNEDIVQQLDEVQEMGVAQMELVNKFDNALSGVTGDGGQTGVVVNAGNRYETGHFWNMETCPEERAFGNDRHQVSLAEEADGTPLEEPARDELAGTILAQAGFLAGAPAYPVGPHCNAVGLTEQGTFLLQEMAARGIMFDPDHMSARAATQALDVLEELDYTGIVSSHSWTQDEVYERIYSLGGMITPYAGGSSGFVNAWRQRLGWVDDRYYFGFGYGADTNGLGGQGGPRNPAEGEPRVEYPFTVPGGAVVHQQVSGERAPYDINTDGVAHYGLYPDWVEDLRVQAGDEIIDDMLRGPEAYLQVWERAVGVERDACHFGDGTTDPTDVVELGMTFDEVLLAAGQPHLRGPEGYTYCGVGKNGKATHVTVSFDADGHVGDITERPAQAPLPALNENRVAVSALAIDATRADIIHEHEDGAEHDHSAEPGARAPEVEQFDLSAAGAVTAAGSADAGTGNAALLALATVLASLGILTRAGRRTD